ncbi:HNH endonuclease [Streptomyces scabiei]|uniref:HNH endonuclease n=2 Tax=Streptomyces scabiei TaxID=1930 RepID=UPI001BB5D4F6|nr:HNH endonuclease [Streptomyces sp. LBUM 1485]MBP5913196.1 HNH endonuclease [Streptomyces sp. LBUM 1486]QTU57384.1 HNH endonuclease [Streptomyces sp. LBUM 1480]
MPSNCADCHSEVTGKIRRGRCENCYRRHIAELKRVDAFTPLASPGKRPQSIPDRMFRRAVPGQGGCVIFTGRTDRDGYAMATDTIRAHRAIYKAVVGEIPAGHVIDHVCHTQDSNCAGGNQCRHRRCVNPYHLEPVTPAENNLRGRGSSAVNARKTHCIHGHEFTPENTRIRPPSPARPNPCRVCRTCHRTFGRRNAAAG